MAQLDPDLQKAAQAAGQGHLLDHWETLRGPAAERFAAQLRQLDFPLVQSLANLLGGGPEKSPPKLDPPQAFPLDRSDAEAAQAKRAAEVGSEHLRRGKVGYVLVAGGQASRLGFDGPKGCFGVGPVSGRPLFGVHAQRLLAARRRHGAEPVWYVMTSKANDGPTREFFRAHDHFGLRPGNVHFFAQEMLPALDDRGRVLLAEPGELFLAPNGHGGVLEGLARAGLLADARDRGIETLSYFQVDNPLARPADPLFLGLHLLEGASMSSKAVDKRSAGEKVGVLGYVDGAMGCIEYSDLPEHLREARDRDGKLRFRAGNIAVHLIQVDFVGELTRGGLQLPYHLARKKMRALDESGRQSEIQGTKFETFVFDALARSARSVVLEVDRALEFSPVKNATGEDSPATTRADLCRLWSQWLKELKLPVPAAGADGLPPVEVDPLLAESLEELRAALPVAPSVSERGHHYQAPAHPGGAR